MFKSQGRRCFFLVLSVLIQCGCQRHLYSPPAQPNNAQGPNTLGKDQTAISGQYALSDDLFGPHVHGGSFTARHGISETLDFEFRGAVMMLRHRYEDDVSTDEKTRDHVMVAARTGAKWAPKALSGHVALTGGFGFGSSEAGQFVSPDVGFIAGWVNAYVTPFYGLTGFLSQPIDPKYVNLADPHEMPDMQRPKLSYGLQQSVGLTAELSAGQTARWSLLAALTSTLIADFKEDTDELLFNGFAIEVGYRF